MKNIAYLKESSPFFDLFPKGQVPIKNILLPAKADLQGVGVTEVYMVDTDQIDRETLIMLTKRLGMLGGDHPSAVWEEITRRGLPLRVSETTGCSTDVPWFL